MRKRCGLARHRSNGHCKVRSLNHRVKCDYSVQRNDEYKQSDCIKARNHKLLDFLHLSRNRYLYLRNRASKVGMLQWTWWLTWWFHAYRFAFSGYSSAKPKVSRSSLIEWVLLFLCKKICAYCLSKAQLGVLKVSLCIYHVFGFFRCDLAFFKGWSGLFCLCLPANPALQ